MQDAVFGHATCQLADKFRLNNTSFMMTFLGPWIGEIDSNTGKTCCRYTILQERHRVLAGNSYILDMVFFQGHQQVPDTGLMYFNTDEVFFGLMLSHLPSRISIAKTNLNNDISLTIKMVFEIQYGFAALDSVVRPEFVQCMLLSNG